MRSTLTLLAVPVLLASSSGASIVGFVEGFDADSANWRNFNGGAVLEWFSTGGDRKSVV